VRTLTLALALLCALLCTDCGGGLRGHVIVVSNAVADGADTGGRALLAGYCVASMRALGRGGEYRDGHCVPTGPDAQREATDAERAALAATRAAWRPVLAAHEAVVRSQRALAAAVAVKDALDADAALVALAGLVQVYRELVAGAGALGIQLPAITGGAP
jgi:hypothetical protein